MGLWAVSRPRGAASPFIDLTSTGLLSQARTQAGRQEAGGWEGCYRRGRQSNFSKEVWKPGHRKSLGKREHPAQTKSLRRQDLDLFEESDKSMRGTGGVLACWVSRRHKGSSDKEKNS